jgi:hypothetical protein
VINETCHVCFLSHTYEGKASDKSLAEFAGYTLPPGSSLYQDRGFQGFYLQDVTIVQPKKKRVEENSHPLRRRRIAVFPPSESVLNTPLAG